LPPRGSGEESPNLCQTRLLGTRTANWSAEPGSVETLNGSGVSTEIERRRGLPPICSNNCRGSRRTVSQFRTALVRRANSGGEGSPWISSIARRRLAWLQSFGCSTPTVSLLGYRSPGRRCFGRSAEAIACTAGCCARSGKPRRIRSWLAALPSSRNCASPRVASSISRSHCGTDSAHFSRCLRASVGADW